MHHRRSAITALSVLLALVAAACAGAAASTTAGTTAALTAAAPAPSGSAASTVASGPAGSAGAGTAPAPSGTHASDSVAPAPSANGDRMARFQGRPGDPPWQLAPTWATHPELLQGSKRFGELARKGRPDPGEPTNVVLFTTDDMAETDLRWMPKTRKLIGGAGVEFTDSISPHPLCCPARAEILTGQFAQNNGVSSNAAPHGGYPALDSSSTLPVWLDGAGVESAFMGKYLNLYGRRDRHEVPPGWGYWRAPVRGTYDYYNYTMNADGKLAEQAGRYETHHYVDLTEKLVPRLASRDRPFFLWQSYLAPHGACPSALKRSGEPCWSAPTPELAYNGAAEGIPMPQRSSPAYDERDVSDKPEYIRAKSPTSPGFDAFLEEYHQRRIESLMSVDDAVARTVDVLEDAGELDNTLLIFTSDNGYMLGEHRYKGKTVPYEPSLQVPLLMRGPTLPEGRRLPDTAATVDLAPTILAALGADPGLPVDGRNLLPVIRGDAAAWETILIQGGPLSPEPDAEWFYRGVRTGRYTYVQYRASDEVELYDRARDPHQLHNVAGDPAYARTEVELQRRLYALEDCAGADCRRRFGPVPEPVAPPQG